jgi:plasmid stabilization system protein ParE
MKRFKVVISPSAEADIIDSFLWGSSNWGVDAALEWAQRLRNEIRHRLRSMPLGYPIAPESADLGIELRQLIIGRYRVLFYMNGNEVRITHVRGSYVGKDNEE